MTSSSSPRPQRTPTPIGPYILWPLKAMKSAPSVATSTARCGTDWHASTTTSAPTACARAASSVTGLTVPSTLETCVKAKTLVRSVSRSSRPLRSRAPSATDRHPAQGRARASGELLPRHEVGVVLHLGHEDLVTGSEHEPLVLGVVGRGRVGEGVRDEVERLGGVLREDDLVGRRPDERRDGRAGGLEVVGRLLRELVRAAVDRGVVLLVERALGVEDRRRLVRRRPRVEVDERPAAAHRARQDRGSRRGSRRAPRP